MLRRLYVCMIRVFGSGLMSAARAVLCLRRANDRVAVTVQSNVPFIALNVFAKKNLQGDVVFGQASAMGMRPWLGRKLIIALIAMGLSATTSAVTPNHGDTITNAVSVTSSVGNANASVNVTAIVRSASAIELLHYAPGASGAQSVPVDTTQCSTSGTSGGPFINAPGPNEVDGTPIAVPGNIDMLPASVYKIGEPVFVRVTDADQNLNAATAETLLATLTTSGGDSELLRLTETGVNTGVFTGYIQIDANAVVANNCVLNSTNEETVGANYVDIADGSDTAVASVLVDPFGIVFDSSTGAPIDNVAVTLIDVATGIPAIVYADDGTTIFPSTVLTGDTFTVGATLYSFPPGGFRFPFVNPGNYRLDVTPTSGYGFPSTVPTPTLQALPGAPFAIVNGSRNENFTVPAGPAVHIDIPLDPAGSGLFMNKTTVKTSASIGDFLQYKLRLENLTAAAIAGVSITDVLPKGFRYQSGSTVVDGATIADPVISPDGRSLVFAVGTIAAASVIDVRYVVEVGSGSALGEANNIATANAGALTSNTAMATVMVREDLLRSRSHVMGRVIVDKCENGPISQGGEGMAGIRLYLEDGTYVITDEKGLYHFEGLRPGTHVVQLDEDSLPPTLEVFECERNTRVAGSPRSRFVDLQGGTVWRADFYLRPKPPVHGHLAMRLHSVHERSLLKYTLTLRGESVIYQNRRVHITLPEGAEYQPGSSLLEGVAIADPLIEGNTLIYDIGDIGKQKWKQVLLLSSTIERSQPGNHVAQAMIVFDTELDKNKQSLVAKNQFLRHAFDVKHYEFRGNFAPIEASLREQDQRKLDETIKLLAGKRVQHIKVVAHTDNLPIADKRPLMFSDNYILSLARAKSVGVYLRDKLGLDLQQIKTIGKGADEPIASNRTEAGRMRNRRVELVVVTSEEKIPPLVITQDDSGPVYTDVVMQYISSNQAQPENSDAQAKVQEPEGIVSLSDGQRLSQRSNSIRVRLATGLKPKLFVDGNEVSAKHIGLRAKDKNTGKTLYTYIGVDIGEAGERTIELKGVGPFGNVRFEQNLTVVRTGEIANIQVLNSEGNVADGKNPITLRIQLLDANKQPINASAELQLKDSKLLPYSSKPVVPELKQQTSTVKVDERGVIRFAPTNRSGLYRGRLVYNGVSQEFKTYVKPKYRDWIMVGLAEGTVGHRTLSGNMQNLEEAELGDKYYQDGRVAFFAKGRIKGKWLLTLAYDSAKEKGEEGNNLHQVIDPKAYYTLYGDATQQAYDAASTEKLYIKLEGDQFYAMFGDYNTGLTITELSRYSRSLTGLKTEYENERFSLTAFASEGDQAFIKDEILGDGTSGLYRLSRQKLLVNSDKVSIETRDRFHSERVITTRTLIRHIDYSIDPVEGTLYFKEPIYSQDANFNPIYIVAEYEVSSDDDNDVIAGGRAAVKAMQGRLEVGATVIHEGTTGAEGDLYGTDLTLKLNEQTEIRAEFAESENTTGTVERSGSAYLAEITHRGKRLEGNAYVREQEAGFGLGQQKGSETGTQKIGAGARYKQTDHITLHGETWREENLATEATRDVVHGSIEYQQDNYTLSGGLRYARDKDGAGVEHISDLLTAGASRSFMDRRIKLRANAEIALEDDENPDFPSRFILGVDYRIIPAVELFAEQEFTSGENQDSQSTRIGARSTPWKSATLTTAVENQTTEYGPRTFASLGLTQGVQINPRLSLDFGLDRSKTMRDPGDIPFNVNVPPASGTVDNDFTAASMGATYRKELWSATARIEGRDAELENKATVLFGFYRQQTPGLGLSASLQYFDTDYDNGNRTSTGDMRFSAAYRPIESRWIVLNRMDLIYDNTIDSSSESLSRKFVNNLNTNYLINRRNQLALQYGFKYALDTFDDEEYDGITQLFGTEYRYDINRRWDLGLRASALHSGNANTYEYSWGLATGVNVAKNLWISVGYNFDGFEDTDFSAADYTAAGPYMKLRLSIDRQTSRDVMAWWERRRNPK